MGAHITGILIKDQENVSKFALQINNSVMPTDAVAAVWAVIIRAAFKARLVPITRAAKFPRAYVLLKPNKLCNVPLNSHSY